MPRSYPSPHHHGLVRGVEHAAIGLSIFAIIGWMIRIGLMILFAALALAILALWSIVYVIHLLIQRHRGKPNDWLEPDLEYIFNPSLLLRQRRANQLTSRDADIPFPPWARVQPPVHRDNPPAPHAAPLWPAPPVFGANVPHAQPPSAQVPNQGRTQPPTPPRYKTQG